MFNTHLIEPPKPVDLPLFSLAWFNYNIQANQEDIRIRQAQLDLLIELREMAYATQHTSR